LEHVDGAGIPDEDGVETFTRDDFESKAAGGVGLGVKIDEEDAPTGFGGAGG
jgi:signal transduction histidine kinase